MKNQLARCATRFNLLSHVLETNAALLKIGYPSTGLAGTMLARQLVDSPVQRLPKAKVILLNVSTSFVWTDLYSHSGSVTDCKNPHPKSKTTHYIARRSALFYKVNPGGPKEDRTPDLCIANAALSQLSYRPVAGDYSVSFPTISSHGDPGAARRELRPPCPDFRPSR